MQDIADGAKETGTKKSLLPSGTPSMICYSTINCKIEPHCFRRSWLSSISTCSGSIVEIDNYDLGSPQPSSILGYRFLLIEHYV